MGTQRATKKTGTAAAQTYSHKSGYELRKRIVEQAHEEIISSDSHGEEKNANKMDIDEVEVLKDSQIGPESKLQRLMVDMVDAQRKRHYVRQQTVHKAYTTAHTGVQEAITSLFDTYETNTAQAYDTQLAILQNLLNEKAKLENAMAAKLATLKTDYSIHSKALQKVIEYRIKELH